MPVRHILISANRAHFATLHCVEGAVVAAVAGVHAKGEETGARHKIARARAPKVLLRDETLDAAIIGGPIKSRAESVRLAAERNLAILLEVPFAPDRAATTKLHRTLQQTRALCVPVLPLRHSAALLYARKLLQKNTASHFHFSLARADESAALWHALDALRQMGGEIARLNCIAAPSSFALSALLSSGATASISARREISNDVAGDDFSLVIEAQHGTIFVDASTVTHAQNRQKTQWKFEDDALLLLHRAFDDAVRNGKRTSLASTWAGALPTQNAWLAALSSARSGKTTKL